MRQVFYLRITIFLTSILLGFFNLLSVNAQEEIRSIDFNNFSYYIEEGGMGPSGLITLNQGMYRDKDSFMSYVQLTDIYYRDFNDDSKEDALIVLISNSGGSGVSSHAYIFEQNSNRIKVIFSAINFIKIQPFSSGFFLYESNKLSTNKIDCDDYLIRTNVIDITLYQWKNNNFLPVKKTTVKGKEICKLLI